jgi:hemerythrin
MITWNPNFETGHPLIDREHRDICDRLNQIETALDNGAGREQIAEMVSLLLDYTMVHFRREESVMACAGCPLQGDNCTAHAQFEARLERWLEVLTIPIPGIGTTLLRDVHTESCRWIHQHMLRIDSSLRHVNSQPAA